MFPTNPHAAPSSPPQLPSGFPFPFLFRFPPPFGFGSMVPPMIPPLPAAFATLLEARMKQLQGGGGIDGIGSDKPLAAAASVVLEKQRKGLQRPTKQINFQLIDGKKPNESINVMLRHTENAAALETICNSDERCEHLSIVAVSAADSVSHTVIYTNPQTLEENEFFDIPSIWKLVCHSTLSEADANLSDDHIVLKPINYGDEIIFFKKGSFDLTNHLEQVSVSEMEETQHQLSDANLDSRSESSSSAFPLSGVSSRNRLLPLSGTPNSLAESQVALSQPSGGGGYQCERCGKMFSYAYYRDKHLKYTRCVDNGDRKFPCPLCTRSFEKRDRLRIHILHVHENHRPHVCNVCGKSFSQSSSLNKHLRVHSGERPYKCPFCTKSFTASSILRTHIRQHSGEKPFKCAFCGKSFASHAAHDSHVRRTHSDQNTANLFKCHSCDKCFDHESHLQFHVQCFHSSD